MKELSIKEFEDFCTALHPKRFLFNSENQRGGELPEQVLCDLDFQSITPNYALNTICFGDKTRRDRLKFTLVKSVRVADKQSVLGTTFSIICRGMYKNSPDSVFTFIAQ